MGLATQLCEAVMMVNRAVHQCEAAVGTGGGGSSDNDVRWLVAVNMVDLDVVVDMVVTVRW